MAHAGGRPKFNIDYATVEAMANVMCTIDEIATKLGCSHDTLQRDEQFCVIYKKGIEAAKASLRAKQFKLADINPTMSIWLGKQYLNQSDKIDQTLSNKDDKPFIVSTDRAKEIIGKMSAEQKKALGIE